MDSNTNAPVKNANLIEMTEDIFYALIEEWEASDRNSGLNFTGYDFSKMTGIHWADYFTEPVSEVYFDGSDLSNQDFTGCSFTNVVFGYAKFDNADFTGVKFNDCDLSGSDLSKCKGWSSIETNNTIMHNAELPSERNEALIAKQAQCKSYFDVVRMHLNDLTERLHVVNETVQDKDATEEIDEANKRVSEALDILEQAEASKTAEDLNTNLEKLDKELKTVEMMTKTVRVLEAKSKILQTKETKNKYEDAKRDLKERFEGVKNFFVDIGVIALEFTTRVPQNLFAAINQTRINSRNLSIKKNLEKMKEIDQQIEALKSEYRDKEREYAETNFFSNKYHHSDKDTGLTGHQYNKLNHIQNQIKRLIDDKVVLRAESIDLEVANFATKQRARSESAALEKALLELGAEHPEIYGKDIALGEDKILVLREHDGHLTGTLNGKEIQAITGGDVYSKLTGRSTHFDDHLNLSDVLSVDDFKSLYKDVEQIGNKDYLDIDTEYAGQHPDNGYTTVHYRTVYDKLNKAISDVIGKYTDSGKDKDDKDDTLER